MKNKKSARIRLRFTGSIYLSEVIVSFAALTGSVTVMAVILAAAQKYFGR